MPKYFYALAGFALLASWNSNDLYPPWLKAHSQFYALIALVFLALPVVVNGVRLTKSGKTVLGVSCIYTIIVFIQVAFSDNKLYFGDAWVWACFLLSAAFAYIVGQNIASNGQAKPATFALLCLFIVSAFIASIMAITQSLGVLEVGFWVNTVPMGARAVANFAQPNLLAVHISTGAIALLVIRRVMPFSSIVLYLVASVLMVGLSLAQSRAGLVMLITAMLWLAYVNSRQNKTIFLSPIYIAFLALFFFFIQTKLSSLLDLSFSRPEINFLNPNGREVLYKHFFDLLVSAPWYGYGPSGIVIAQYDLAALGQSTLLSTWSHNILLDALLVFGIPMGLIAVCYIGWAAFALLKTIFCKRIDSVVVVLPLAIGSFFEFPFAYTFFLLPAMFLLGLVDQGRPEQYVQQPTSWLISKFIPTCIWCVFTALIAFNYFEYFKLEEDFRAARFESANIGNTHQNYEKSKIYILDQLDELVKQVRRKPNASMDTLEIEAMEKSMKRFPFSIAMMRYAIALKINGRESETARVINAAGSFHGPKAKEKIQLELKNTDNKLVN